jgi:hypothetical protein
MMTAHEANGPLSTATGDGRALPLHWQKQATTSGVRKLPRFLTRSQLDK